MIRLNSTLNNSENKIQAKFCDALGLKEEAKGLTAMEMVAKVQEYFEECPGMSILFIFEDIDYYVETTKQLMLYKILETLQHCQIKFVFLATSMKLDIVDSFEKRIKSRFSHRSELLYTLSLETFLTNVKAVIDEKVDLARNAGEGMLEVAYLKLWEFISSGVSRDVLTAHHSNGK